VYRITPAQPKRAKVNVHALSTGHAIENYTHIYYQVSADITLCLAKNGYCQDAVLTNMLDASLQGFEVPTGTEIKFVVE
jgi:hypothetical protein